MSDAEWDADDFDPDKKVSEVAAAAATAKPAATDKWDGEDEDDDAKDEWDKSSGDEGDENRPRALQRKKKKKLEDILEEKAAKQKALLDAKATDSAAKKQMNTPEGRATERARLQKEQENSSYELAKDMMGLGVTNVDKMIPVSKEDFVQFEKELADKISNFSSSEQYPEFVENLIRRLCADLPAAALKNVKKNAEAAHSVKLKDEQAAKTKKGKGKGASLKYTTEKDLFSGETEAGGYNDMDDFM